MRNNQGLKCQLLVLVDTTHSEKQIKGRAKRPQPSSLAERNAPTCHPTSGLHEKRKRKKKVSASSVLWLQTHFLRQSTVLNFKMSSPISWSAVSVKTSSLSVHQQLLDKQYLPEHGSLAWKCVNSCCSNPVNSQWTTESRWELQVFLYWYFLLFHPREL